MRSGPFPLPPHATIIRNDKIGTPGPAASTRLPDSPMPPQSADDARVRDLLAILEITPHLTATVELDKLLAAVEESTRTAIGCERAAVFLHDKQTDELYSMLATGVTGIRFPAGRGVAGA